MKTLTKKALPMLLVGGMLVGTAGISTSNAYADSVKQTSSSSYQKEMEQIKNFKPSQEAVDFMAKVVKSGAIKEFDYTSDLKVMSYKHDMDTIKNTYNFSDEDIVKLNQIVNSYNESMKKNTTVTGNLLGQGMKPITKGGPQYVDTDYGWTWIKLTFTNEETKLMLAGAAAEGAYAMYGVFVGMSAITATPVGGAIMVVLGGLGLPKFVSVCQTVGRALVAGKGVSVEIGMDGVIPYISASVARH